MSLPSSEVIYCLTELNLPISVCLNFNGLNKQIHHNGKLNFEGCENFVWHSAQLHGLIEKIVSGENAPLAGWEVNVVGLEGSDNGRSVHTLSKNIHIVLQGSTILSQTKAVTVTSSNMQSSYSFRKLYSFTCIK